LFRRKRPIDDFFMSLILFMLMISVAYGVMWSKSGPTVAISRLSGEPEPANSRKNTKARKPASSSSSQSSKSSAPDPAPEANQERKRQRKIVKPLPANEPKLDISADDQIQSVIDLVDGGQWEEAEQMLLDILKNDPDNEMALVEIAMIQLIDRKDSNSAFPYVRRAITINPDNEGMIMELVNISEELGNANQIIDFINELDESQGSNGALEQAKAMILQNMGQPDDALASLNQAVEKSEYKDEIYERIGDLHIENENPQAAIEAYLGAIENIQNAAEDPEFSAGANSIKLKLAESYIRIGQWDNAISILEQQLSMTPEDDWIADLLQAAKQGKDGE